MALHLFFAVSKRTVRTWRAQGAPLKDAKALLSWLGKRRRSTGTVALRIAERGAVRKLKRFLDGDLSELKRSDRDAIRLKRRAAESLILEREWRAQLIEERTRALRSKTDMMEEKRRQMVAFTENLELRNTGLGGSRITVTEAEERRRRLLALFAGQLKILETQMRYVFKYPATAESEVREWLANAQKALQVLSE